MNYRHAYHAGNHADVLKHVVLARVLAHLALKAAPFRAIDTHAGIGFYDLEADEAARTGEWRDGVGRLEAPFAPEVEAVLAPYRAALAAVRERRGPTIYPGSPALIREALRRGDRGVFVELHPADAALLRERYGSDPLSRVMALDGWTALHALVPPPERRGLVLIDPPYEERGELDRLALELARAARKWPTGTYLAWYPIKDRAPVERMARAAATGIARPILRLELRVRQGDDPARLNGSGLLVVNPPWTLEEAMRLAGPALAERLAPGAGAFRCEIRGA